MVTSTSIGSITWSDHADITLQITLPNMAKTWSWRLNPTLLHNPNIKEAIKDYFDLNKDSVSTKSSLWAAHKTVLRGILITLASNYPGFALLEQTLTELRTLETKLKSNPTPELNVNISKYQNTIKEFMAKDSIKVLQWTWQLYYETSNKADTLLLAHKLKRR
ncbi:Hypothetical predicted protein [Pelobates cultripes]|uniref:Uncharacterized protein n=1 Tax=Pelobates cultripes TaxID=61616 RepID=A0AAD1R5B6_PELCU|nr:Hypothetical predicted protein [Pelobates cultripes]